MPLWKICILRILQAEEILIGCFVECQSIKKVGGRRFVEELYQALEKFKALAPGMNPVPTPLPAHLLPENWETT